MRLHCQRPAVVQSSRHPFPNWRCRSVLSAKSTDRYRDDPPSAEGNCRSGPAVIAPSGTAVMRGELKLDLSAIVTGVAAYIAIAGWLVFFPLFGFVLSSFFGDGTPGDFDAESIVRQFVAVAIYFACGYFTGRASEQSPVYNAAILGVVLFLLVSFFDRMLWSLFDLAVPFDFADEAASLARSVLATLVGGTAAEWQIRTRGAAPVRFHDFSRRTRTTLFVLAIAPFAFLALTYRP